jgi:hypothetical protein
LALPWALAPTERLHMSNDDKIRLDLNVPIFQKKLFELDTNDVKKVFKTFQKLQQLTWNEVFRDHGLKWEQIKNEPNTFTIRLSQSYRAVVERDGEFMLFQTLHLDHDSAYGKK